MDKCLVIMKDGKPCSNPVSYYETDEKTHRAVNSCIFHAHSKDSNKFQEAFLEKLQRELADNSTTLIDCSKFVFPSTELIGLEVGKSICFNEAQFSSSFSIRKCQFSGELFDLSYIEPSSRGFFLYDNTFRCKSIGFKGIKSSDWIFIHNCSFDSKLFQLSIDSSSEGWFHLTEAIINSENIKFSYSDFMGNSTKFSKCKFSGEKIDFSYCTFGSKSTEFEECEFKASEINFENCTYGKSFTIKDSFFDGDLTTFEKSKFAADEVLFDSISFKSKYTLFDNSVINGRLIMRGFTEGHYRLENIPFSFKNLFIVNKRGLEFRHINLSCSEFIGTDIRNIAFVDVMWCRKKSVNRNMLSKNVLFDEYLANSKLKYEKTYSKKENEILVKFEKIDTNPSETDFELICLLYRQLKQNYEDNRNFAEAGDFYYGEMEMRRRKLPWYRRYLLSWEFWYWLVSGYGQGWENSLGLMLLFFGGSPLLFLKTGLDFIYKGIHYPADYWHAFQFNFLTITFQKDIGLLYDPSIVTRNTAIIESLVMPVLGTLFVLALRRRFKR